MAAAPEGTVTLLFSDIEGSTSLLKRAGNAYPELLLQHRQLMRRAFASHGGYEVDTAGDAFFVVFPTVTGAAAAALEAQRSLRDYPWPKGLDVRVRIGLHTGEPELHDGAYIGLAVHHAARVMAAGHGDQILLTQATRELLSAGSPVRDLGDHRLKDLTGPQRLYQLGPGDFPPLKTLHRSNLPVPASPFIGREDELGELAVLIAGSRLVTLTGAGGSGKTRLALQAAAAAADSRPDGVWFLGLAAVEDARAIRPALAVALGAAEDGLDAFLEPLRALIVLDNLEQVAGAGEVVADLLQAAPFASFIVTTRERLGLLAEQEFPVPTLDRGQAVELFIARARRVKPSFAPDEAVVEICERVDGLPLAVELAAGRVGMFTSAQILERLADALSFLTSRAPDVPERQRTLRATIDWSYRLLPDAESKIFVALGAFSGSFDLEAAEHLAGASLDDVAAFVDKNLVRPTNEGRFFLYETLREYARERQAEAQMLVVTLRRHALYYTHFAEQAEPEFEREDQLQWFDRLDAERDNVRAALEWSLTHDTTLALRLVGSLWLYWSVRGPLLESIQFCERALAAAGSAEEHLPKAMLATSYLTNRAGNAVRARELAETAAAAYEARGDTRGRGRALRDLANALSSLEDWEHAKDALDQAAACSRAAGDDWNLAIALNNLGYVARASGDLASAIALTNGSVELRRRLGDWRGLVISLQNRTYAEIELERLDDARASVIESVQIATRLGYREGIAGAIMPLGAALALSGAHAEGIRLASAGLRSDEDDGLAAEEPEQRVIRKALDAARAEVGDEHLDRWWDEGRELSLDDAVALALEVAGGSTA